MLHREMGGRGKGGMALELADRVYIVTGASRGVGLAICAALHAKGASFAMLARSGDEVNAHAEGFGDRALALVCDVTDRDSVEVAVAATVARFGGLDGLVNNAGASKISPVERLQDDDLLMMLHTNLLGPLKMIQACLPHLRARGGGNIVNISSASVADLSEFPFLGGYAATKAALERLTLDLRAEVSRDNIAITTFRLGSTLTYFGTGWSEEVAAEAFAEWDARGGTAPLTMDPALPAEAITWCLQSPPGACTSFIEFRPYLDQPKGRAMAG